MAQPSESYIPQTDNAAASRKTRTVQRTDGADTVEEWLQSTSEPFLPSYRINTSSAIALVTANSHVLQIMAGASLRVGIRRITVYQAVNATTTASNQWGIYRLTSAGTGGTAITPAPLDPADTSSGATAMTLPSSKGTESTLIEYRHVLLHTAVTTVGINPVAQFDFEHERTKGLWIAAGAANGIALKNISSDTAATVRIVVDFVEADWT